MKIKLLAKCALIAAAFTFTAVSNADETTSHAIYVSGGSSTNNNSDSTGNKSAFSLGYLNLSKTHDVVWGIDISGEGTKYDSTWGQNKSKQQAISYNLLIGKNIGKTENFRFDATAILGIREDSTSCPRSNLGYRCYADQAPDSSYAMNYGFALTWSSSSLLFGLRATGESSQAMIGVIF